MLKAELLESRKVDAIFVGGGSPSLLSPRQIELLGESLNRHFDLRGLREFTFEVEVKSVSREKLQAMRDIGVNRISFGAQTFSEKYRALLSLDAPRARIFDVAAMLNDMFPYTNVDLLYGMAGQNLNHLCDDFANVVALQTTTIDVYPLNNLAASGVMHRAMKAEHLDFLPASSRLRFRMRLDELFRERGYVPINGYSYALADTAGQRYAGPVQHRPQFLYHDILYGYEDDEIVGYGSAALSRLPGFNLHNTANRQAYVTELERGRSLPHQAFGPISAPERGIVYFPYRGTLDKSRIAWNEVPTDTVAALREISQAGLAAETDQSYELTPLGWLFYVNLMYYLMPLTAKAWLSDLIADLRRRGRACGDTDLTVLASMVPTVGSARKDWQQLMEF
jgi:oxygen-independent coproporphyrinogen-3 oxidase